MNVPVFLFTFGSYEYNFDEDKECRYTVYSYDDKDIWKFIHQYGCFDLNSIKIDVINIDDQDGIYYNGDWLSEDNRLSVYKFKSNKNHDEIYEVISTNEILSHILNTEIDKMMLTLELGTILKHYKHIEFINKIVTLLSELNHIYFELETNNDGDEVPVMDESSIYESFTDFQLSSYINSVDVLRDHISELTIEGYVSGFTDIMIPRTETQ